MKHTNPYEGKISSVISVSNGILMHMISYKSKYSMGIVYNYCQPQVKAKAKAMPGRLYIHTIH